MSSIKNALNKARNYALKRTDIEILVRDATSNEKWGPSGTQMSQIAQATFSHADFTLVMNTLWERINDHGKNWRHIYKALLVIEYLLRCGSERVISDCRSKMIEIKTLIEFQKIDDHDKDVGYSIRERAKHVVEMLHDDKRLQDEREKAAKNRDKYHVAVSNVGGSGPQYSSTSSAYNSTSSAYNTGSTRKPMTSMGYTPGQGTYGSAMRETRDRDSSRDSHGSGLEPRGSFRSSSQSNSRETTRDSSRDQPPRATTQSRARAPSISDDEYSISDDEPQRPSTTQPRRPSNSAPNTNNTTVDDFFAPRGGSFVSAPSTAPTPAANSTDPLWALLAGPSAPSQPTVPTMNSGYTPFSFPPAPTSSTTTPTTNGAMLFQNSVPSTTHSFQAMSLNTASVSNNTGNFFPSPRKDEDDWKDFTKTGTSSNTPSTNSLSNQLGVKSDLIDLDSLTANKRVDTKPGAATTYRPIVASSTTAMTPNSGMMNNTMGYNMNTPTMGGNMMNPTNMGTGMTYNGNMMMNNPGMNNMGMNTGMNPNNGMMMNNTGMMNPNGNMMNPNMMNNNMMYNNSMMTPNGGMMMNNYGMQPVNNNANSFKF